MSKVSSKLPCDKKNLNRADGMVSHIDQTFSCLAWMQLTPKSSKSIYIACLSNTFLAKGFVNGCSHSSKDGICDTTVLTFFYHISNNIRYCSVATKNRYLISLRFAQLWNLILHYLFINICTNPGAFANFETLIECFNQMTYCSYTAGYMLYFYNRQRQRRSVSFCSMIQHLHPGWTYSQM